MQECGAWTFRDGNFILIKREAGTIVTKDMKVMQIGQHCINRRLVLEFSVGIDLICSFRTKISVRRELDGNGNYRRVPTEVAQYDLTDC